MNHLQRAKRVFDIEIEGLRHARAQLDAHFTRAVDLIAHALATKNKIIVTGIGKSANLAHKIAATLTSTGSTSVVLDSVNALHGDLGVLHDGDIILALSYSGETEELLRLLPAVKRFDVKLIALTAHARSTLARHADAILNVSVPQEACPFNLAPTASTTAMLAMADALAMTLLDARGFKKSDYARLHPAGAIGNAMLVQIKDIMRSGDRNAVISETATVQEALLAMTKAKSGTISIVNKNGRVTGVFTDGDFRRHISRDRAILDAPVRSVMTPNPITIRHNALAVEALKIFQQRQIDDLVVVDEKKRPIGVVDSQDLPKFKLM